MARPKDISRSKQFRKGISQLDEECVVQVLVSDRRGDQAPWRYQLHLATQIEPLRQVRNGLTSARRSVRSVQRDRRGGRQRGPHHLPALRR